MGANNKLNKFKQMIDKLIVFIVIYSIYFALWKFTSFELVVVVALAQIMNEILFINYKDHDKN